MPLISTQDFDPAKHSSEAVHQVYCALDSMLTPEIHEKIEKEHGSGINSRAYQTYQFEKALQAPLLEMSLRGFKIDGIERHKREIVVQAEVKEARKVLDELAAAVWNKGLNPRGYAKQKNGRSQLAEFFYDVMGIPEVVLSFKGERKVSVNREALEKISEYLYARPFVTMILHIRDLYKELDILTEEIDPDGRHRTSYNIGGTETGRLSSSTSVLGTGGNAQNITPELRRVFVADPNFKLCSIDLEQVEARDVGFLLGALFNDWTLLDSAEAADLHTTNCMLCWPELSWSRDMAANRSLAERTPLYRDWSLRDGTKRMGHLTNYMGTEWMISRVLKIPIEVARDFQLRYKAAYPGLPRYWQWCAEQIQTKGFITTPFGRTRHFFGDPRSDATLREAIAFVPQSMTADRTNLWLWKVWASLGTRIQLLAQTHDSITFQFREEDSIDDIIRTCLELLNNIRFTDSNSMREYSAPGEAKVGWNWAPYWGPEDNERLIKEGKKPKPLNPEGLKKWKPGEADKRRRAVGEERLK